MYPPSHSELLLNCCWSYLMELTLAGPRAVTHHMPHCNVNPGQMRVKHVRHGFTRVPGHRYEKELRTLNSATMMTFNRCPAPTASGNIVVIHIYCSSFVNFGLNRWRTLPPPAWPLLSHIRKPVYTRSDKGPPDQAMWVHTRVGKINLDKNRPDFIYCTYCYYGVSSSCLSHE